MEFSSYYLQKISSFYLEVILWLNWCETSSFGDIEAINCDNAWRGSYGTSTWPHSMHKTSIHRDNSSMMWSSPSARASPIGLIHVWRLRDIGLLPMIVSGALQIHVMSCNLNAYIYEYNACEIYTYNAHGCVLNCGHIYVYAHDEWLQTLAMHLIMHG